MLAYEFGDTEIKAVTFAEGGLFINIFNPNVLEYVTLRFADVSLFYMITDQTQNVIERVLFDEGSKVMDNVQFLGVMRKAGIEPPRNPDVLCPDYAYRRA